MNRTKKVPRLILRIGALSQTLNFKRIHYPPVEVEPPEKYQLRQRLQQGALRTGFATDRWTLKRIQQLIKRGLAIRQF